MALIKEIRQRTGLAIGVIAGGLILFLLGGDLLSPNSSLLGNNNPTVGEIAGEDVTYQEYVDMVEEFRLAFQQRTGRAPSEAELVSVRDQAWQSMIVERVFKEEYETLGLTISPDELVDLVQGKNILPELRQQMTNPQTGEFDKSQLISFLQSLETADPAQQAFWAQQEQIFADSRLRVKYDNMLIGSEYVNSAEAKLEHKAVNSIAEASVLFIPYYAIADSAIQVSESDLTSYLKKNSEKFKTGNTASLEYITFSIQPSSMDSAIVIEEITQLSEELRDAESDSAFVSRYSDLRPAFYTFRPGDQLPEDLTRNVESPQQGEIYGPFVTANSSYMTFKITEKYAGTPRMKASHILFSTEGMDQTAKGNVRTQAEEVLQDLKNGGNFAQAARDYGQDGTAQRGGDLGWFAKEDFVEEFAEATYARRTTGLLPNLVETEYGYHIIEVTELPKAEYMKVAILQKDLIASDETRNEAFRNADALAAESGNRNEFTENATEANYRILQANNVEAKARNLNNLQNAREIIRWAFADASEGDVSPVFELENAFIVASLISRKEAGDASLADVREQVEEQVRNDKKAAAIQEALKGKESLEDMKAVYGDDASLSEIPDLKLSSSVIPGIGFAPKFVGSIFGLEQGQISQPIQEDVGVLVGRLNTLTSAPEIGDYSAYQNQLIQSGAQRASYQVMMALEDLADVKDYRYKFF